MANTRRTITLKTLSKGNVWELQENDIIRMWQACGLQVKSAGDSQALIQLKKEYCDKKDCLRCRIGYEYLRASR